MSAGQTALAMWTSWAAAIAVAAAVLWRWPRPSVPSMQASALAGLATIVAWFVTMTAGLMLWGGYFCP